MAQTCRPPPPQEDGRRWLRQLTEAVTGWGRGELDRPLPRADEMPSDLLELRASLELTRRRLRADQEGRTAHGTLRDGLTGIPNREHFTALLQRMVARLARHGGSGALLLLDIDNFRNVNNDLGHEAGDRLLVAVAQRLAAGVRAEDALARMGGDEYAVLLEGTGRAGALTLAERLLESFAMPFPVGGNDVLVTASIGLAEVDPDAGEAAELLRRGDVALYVAKRTGKATATVYDPIMDVASRGRLHLEADLRQAPGRSELRLHYQPVFSLPAGEVIAVEALLRWEHPTRGLLAPGAFIALAEETGLIVPLGEWVLEAAAAEQARLRQRFDGPIGVPVQVNVSARQFRDPDFLGAVAQNLDRHGIPPGGFGIEITESVVLEDTAGTVTLLRRLRELGTTVSVDDFGIGYSSLTYLRHFPFDILKLDRSFIEHIADEVEARTVVQAVIRLGHDLGLTVVAEGVEDEAQQRWLQQWGCDAAQGFLFARPMPSDQLDDFLDDALSPP
ncbi:MAG: putative bifunctional diguanylate cyclase/phosphodiesterase [Acidimicrobiia bacterium]